MKKELLSKQVIDLEGVESPQPTDTAEREKALLKRAARGCLDDYPLKCRWGSVAEAQPACSEGVGGGME